MSVQLMDLEEVAAEFSCTVKAVRKLIGRGELPALKLSPRRTRVLKADAEKYVLEKLARKG